MTEVVPDTSTLGDLALAAAHDPADQPRRGAQTPKKMLTLLRLVVDAPDGLPLSELVRLSGLNKATAYRLLKFLEDEGLVLREEGSGRYTTGAGMIALAAAALEKMSVRELARPMLKQIAEMTTETVLLYVRRGHSRVCIDGIEASHAVRRGVQVGRVVPMYSGPTGIVLLAHVDPEEREAILAEAAAAGEDVKRLRKELDGVIANGYAEQYTNRLGAFAVPVFFPASPLAAITVSGPQDRCTKKTMAPFIPLVLAETRNLASSR